MDPMPDYSLFLGRILEELDAKHSSMSYQDLCKSLCARFDLVHLVKLRSLLFYTACLDPCFPATLFRDKMRATTEDQQSRKLMAAADIVTMFNLIQMNNGTAKDRLPSAHRPKFHKNQSFESCRSDSDMYKYSESDRSRDLLYSRGRRISPCPKSECGDRQPFVPSSNSGCHLGINRDLKYRAASLDKLQHLPPYHPNSPTSCDMQSTYFPMEIDSESTTDQDSLQLNPGIKAKLASHREPFSVYSCVQKRNIFKEDFHNLVAFCPQVITTDSKHICNHSGTFQRKEPQKPAAFFNHSFELPYSNPYFESVGSPLQVKRRSKHESLDDLQASTYFGPTTITESINARRTMGRQGKQPSWPVKSMSLNTDDGPDFEGCLVGSKLSKDGHGRNISSAGSEKHYQGNKDKSSCSPSRFSNQSNGPKSLEAGLLANGRSADNREALMRFKDKSINCPSLQPADIDDGLSVGTQTEQSDPKKLKDFGANNKYTERHSFKISDEDSEIVSDDISDIFRFLDDMSVSGSLGVIQSSCYNSNGSLTQIAKSDGDSSPEHGATKLKKAGLKLDRLFSSLENTDGELKASVCKLVLRIGEIEKKLESLSGVRGEISQVLSKLNKLDEKIQEPEDTGKPCEDGRVHETHVESNTAPVIFQCHTTGNSLPVGGTVDWCCSEASGSTSDSLRVKALKKSVFTRRSSRSLNEENSVTESKIASITNSPRDWRASCPSHPVVDGTEKERNCKDRHRKSKEMDRQGDAVCTHRSSKPAKEQPYLVEQVFTPHRFPPVAKVQTRGSPLYADLRLVERSDGKRSQPPPWPLEEYKLSSGEKAKLSALDLQTQESLNPNHLEYWMEDIYSPGYDSLLKRKEAEFRRAKACKMGVLIAAAACTVILVIVVPMCTMKS